MPSQQVPKAPKGLQIEGDDPRKATWEPPPSPFGLIEEVLYEDPWRLLLACILLMKTSGRQVTWPASSQSSQAAVQCCSCALCQCV